MAQHSPLYVMGLRTKRQRVHAGRSCIPTGKSLNYHHQPCLRNGNGCSLRVLKSKAREVLVGCNAHRMGGGDDNRALETVLKLYSAIKNKSFTQLSDVIGEECLCICNFASSLQPFHGKEQVLAFFSSLMKILGNNIEFVVQPTFHDGMNVGISWKLEWSKNHVPLGKGFSFCMCHIYQGKVVIQNVDMFLEPILHIEPFRLQAVTFLTNAMDHICSRAVFKGKAKGLMKILLFLILMAAIFVFAS
ncbi:OLC1v1020808C1 [Oldenlandia corymbosa var. corymbosa]|uniref:OLC1v1020808C1 n=1 Tax=Oldenlandia corymbosa var. corymbosa TaxID=529605 RepID=A0AAV1BUL0_OLDCO|nr:OLC1v1020808C1 [Oldenlandia corymbosa var. corymbosa]